jgi:hypothetical protein
MCQTARYMHAAASEMLAIVTTIAALSHQHRTRPGRRGKRATINPSFPRAVQESRIALSPPRCILNIDDGSVAARSCNLSTIP